MAYRRRQGITRASTFKEEIVHRPPEDNPASNPLQSSSSFSGSSSLAAQAIRASALSAERNNNNNNRSKVSFFGSFSYFFL